MRSTIARLHKGCVPANVITGAMQQKTKCTSPPPSRWIPTPPIPLPSQTRKLYVFSFFLFLGGTCPQDKVRRLIMARKATSARPKASPDAKGATTNTSASNPLPKSNMSEPNSRPRSPHLTPWSYEFSWKDGLVMFDGQVIQKRRHGSSELVNGIEGGRK